jgi:hypothetical protein
MLSLTACGAQPVDGQDRSGDSTWVEVGNYDDLKDPRVNFACNGSTGVYASIGTPSYIALLKDDPLCAE